MSAMPEPAEASQWTEIKDKVQKQLAEFEGQRLELSAKGRTPQQHQSRAMSTVKHFFADNGTGPQISPFIQRDVTFLNTEKRVLLLRAQNFSIKPTTFRPLATTLGRAIVNCDGGLRLQPVIAHDHAALKEDNSDLADGTNPTYMLVKNEDSALPRGKLNLVNKLIAPFGVSVHPKLPPIVDELRNAKERIFILQNAFPHDWDSIADVLTNGIKDPNIDLRATIYHPASSMAKERDQQLEEIDFVNRIHSNLRHLHQQFREELAAKKGHTEVRFLRRRLPCVIYLIDRKAYVGWIWEKRESNQSLQIEVRFTDSSPFAKLIAQYLDLMWRDSVEIDWKGDFDELVDEFPHENTNNQ